MGNLSALSGAPALVIFFIFNQFFTNFGLNLYPAFTFFIAYGGFYILFRLYTGNGLNTQNRNIFLFHLFLLLYAFFIFYFYELGFLQRETSSWWSISSLVKFISIIIATLVVIISPIQQIYKSLYLIRNISYFIVVGSLFYYLLEPFGIGFFSSDELAGFRYNGGINSYIVTGQFLIAGMIAHILLHQKSKFMKLLFAIGCFFFAVVATGDRTSILAMLIILSLLFYRSGFDVTPFIFKVRKNLIFLFLVPSFSVFGFFQYQSIVSGEIDAYKSTIHRAAITIRSYELFKDVFPIGAGPGSQTYLMNEKKIQTDFSEETGSTQALTAALMKEVDSFQSGVGRKQKLSPHNTYFDFLVPFGLIGAIFVFFVILTQIGALKRILFKKSNSTVILDTYMVSALLFFMFSSLFNLWWLYIIFYRVLLVKKGLVH